MKILIPIQLQKIIGKSEIESNADSIDSLLVELCLEYTNLKSRLFSNNGDGDLNKFINIYVNDEDIRFLNFLKTELKPTDVVSIVPAVAGG